MCSKQAVGHDDFSTERTGATQFFPLYFHIHLENPKEKTAAQVPVIRQPKLSRQLYKNNPFGFTMFFYRYLKMFSIRKLLVKLEPDLCKKIPKCLRVMLGGPVGFEPTNTCII
jgi:hypothetical protein